MRVERRIPSKHNGAGAKERGGAVLGKVGEGQRFCKGGQRQMSTWDRQDSMWRSLQETRGPVACKSAQCNALGALCIGRALQERRRGERVAYLHGDHP